MDIFTQPPLQRIFSSTGIGPVEISSSGYKKTKIRIRVIYDKEGLGNNLHTGWGVSFLIDDRILFDTGERGKWLLENMRTMEVELSKIETIVISHDHWDHCGGLWDLLRHRKGIPVYICPRFGKGFKDKALGIGANLIEIEKFTPVAQNVFSTGEIPGAYKEEYVAEQALVLETENGLTIITGCAHPGISEIVKQVQFQFPTEHIHLVMGGFHLRGSNKQEVEMVVDDFKKRNITRVGPTHCSGDMAKEIFKNRYGDNFDHIKTGQDIEV